MRIESAPKKEVWRGRGRPRREIPREVRHFADSTYKTGNVQVVTIEAGEEEELKELIGYCNSYANSLGRRMRVQRDGDVVRFEMVDIQKRKAKAA
jgi:hypothetical protein